MRELVLLVYNALTEMSIRYLNMGEVNRVRVGAILKACRTRAGLSQEELASRLFISQSDVSKYENDTMEPHISTLQAWTSNTQAPEVLVAFICGMDGLNIMQNLLDAASTAINTILLGGIF